MRGKFIDLTGQRHGRLTVLNRTENGNRGQTRWLCRCDCGGEKTIQADHIRSGHTRSCGCLRREVTRKRRSLPKGLAAFNGLVATMKVGAKKRGHEWQLTKEQVRHLTKQPCHYCGVEPLQSIGDGFRNGAYIYNGIDRVDNTKGYVIDNVVACCFDCNRSKGTQTVSEYKKWIDRVYNFEHST